MHVKYQILMMPRYKIDENEDKSYLLLYNSHRHNIGHEREREDLIETRLS